jgi:glycosyl transferase, family 25
MSGQFSSVGMPVTRVAAVDCNDPAVAAEAARCEVGQNGRQMSAGAYACFQSHRRVWAMLVASGEAHAMVMEDDLLLAPGIGVYLDDGWVPPGSDVVKLETVGVRVHVAAKVQDRAGPRALRRLMSYHSGMAGYVISSGAAAMLLDLTGQVSDPVDEVVFNPDRAHVPTIRLDQMIPAPVIQGDRPMAGSVRQPWAKASIVEHWDKAEPVLQREGQGRRLLRRISHEIRAARSGSRYIVVPHG